MDGFFPEYTHRYDFDIEKIQLICKKVYPARIKKRGTPYTDAVSVTLSAGDEAIVDFKMQTVGDLSFVAHGKGSLRVIYGEYQQELYYDTVEPEVGWYDLPIDSYCIDGTEECTSRGRRAFRYLRIVSDGFNGSIDSIVMAHLSYPIADKGYFFCSDEKLNRIWEICENTTHLCMHQFYEDGIKRDGLLWLGDCHVQARCGMSLYGEALLLKRSLMYFAMSMRGDGRLPSNATIGGAHQHPARIRYMFDGKKLEGDEPTEALLGGVGKLFYSSYAMDFTDMLWEYYDFTGDTEFVKQLFPYVRKNMEYLCNTLGADIKNHLLPVSKRCLPFRKYIDVLSEPCAGFTKMLYTLNNYELLCTLVGVDDADSIAKWRTLYTAEADSCVRNGKLYDTKDSDTRSPTAQAFRYFSGGFDNAQAKTAFTDMQTDPRARKNLDGFAKYWYMLAKAECGMMSEVLNEIKHEYAQMLDNGATTCWEKFDGDCPELFMTERTGSRCHGWSAGPADIFARCVLGVRWSASQKTLTVSPDLGGLDFAEGKVLTPIGAVSVEVYGGKVRIALPESDYKLVIPEGLCPEIKYIKEKRL